MLAIHALDLTGSPPRDVQFMRQFFQGEMRRSQEYLGGIKRGLFLHGPTDVHALLRKQANTRTPFKGRSFMTTHCDDLSAHVIERLITAAQLGWAPADLEHVLGPHAYPIIYRASPHVPARITSPALRKAWLQMAPPDENFIPRDKLRAIMKELIHLGGIKRWMRHA